MLRRNTAYAAAILAAFIIALAGLWAATGAQKERYRFEAVSEEIAAGDNARIEVRLLGPDSKPVASETVTLRSTRLDMGPDGMAAMDSALKPVASDKPGIFAFEADIVMAGRWELTIEARIDGAPVRGSVIYTAVKEEKEARAAPAPSSERKILYYRNPMGLPDISKIPKKDAMGMDYIPVYADDAGGPPGSVRIAPEKVQRAGVRTTTAERRTLSRTVRGAGMIMADESRLAVVTAKFSGFIEKLDVCTTGETVTEGEPLLTAWVESDDLVQKMVDLSSSSGDKRLEETAKRNLRLFDVPESDIAAIATGRAPKRTITFNAPLSGTVLEKPALEGMRFEAGDTLYRIGDLSEVWVITEVAEQDLAVVREGQKARLSLPAMPGAEIEGVVDFIYPEIDTQTRSGRARLSIPNPDGRLKLGLYARAEIKAPMGDAPLLAVPASAVIDDGQQRRVFVAKGDGLFEPREIETGARAGDFIAVKSGLVEGEKVVVHGTFLIDAESNLQAALAAFGPQGSAP